MGKKQNQADEKVDAVSVTDCFANEHITDACSPVKNLEDSSF